MRLFNTIVTVTFAMLAATMLEGRADTLNGDNADNSGLSASALAAKVKMAEAKDPALQDDAISVGVVNGVVILSGVATTPIDVDHAIDVARTVSGGMDVNSSNLLIK